MRMRIRCIVQKGRREKSVRKKKKKKKKGEGT